MIAIVGIILLIGIVKKNGIMLVDFAQHVEYNEGLTPEKAIYQACVLRFRPILVTTMAALLGGVPMMVMELNNNRLRSGVTSDPLDRTTRICRNRNQSLRRLMRLRSSSPQVLMTLCLSARSLHSIIAAMDKI